MEKCIWQIQEAKNRLSEVVESAVQSGVQTITKHGKPVAVVISTKEYGELKPESEKTLWDWLRSCPDPGIDELDLERIKEPVREIDFG